MKYVKLGKTGVAVSRICLGCMSYGTKRWREWVLTEDEAREHFARAIEAGINFFDTANVYSVGVSEQITGRWLSEMGRRDELVIATKVHGRMAEGAPTGTAVLSRKRIISNPARPRCAGAIRPITSTFTRSDLMGLHHAGIEEIPEALADSPGPLRAGPLPGRQQHGGVAILKAAVHGASESGWHRFEARCSNPATTWFYREWKSGR